MTTVYTLFVFIGLKTLEVLGLAVVYGVCCILGEALNWYHSRRMGWRLFSNSDSSDKWVARPVYGFGVLIALASVCLIMWLVIAINWHWASTIVG